MANALPLFIYFFVDFPSPTEAFLFVFSSFLFSVLVDPLAVSNIDNFCSPIL